MIPLDRDFHDATHGNIDLPEVTEQKKTSVIEYLVAPSAKWVRFEPLRKTTENKSTNESKKYLLGPSMTYAFIGSKFKTFLQNLHQY